MQVNTVQLEGMVAETKNMDNGGVQVDFLWLGGRMTTYTQDKSIKPGPYAIAGMLGVQTWGGGKGELTVIVRQWTPMK